MPGNGTYGYASQLPPHDWPRSEKQPWNYAEGPAGNMTMNYNEMPDNGTWG